MKVVKYIKKNSSAVVGVTVFILVIVAILLIKNVFMFDENEAIYGSRLDGIDKVKISSDQKSKAESKVKDGVKSVKVRVTGRTVNSLIVTNDDTSIEDAKKLADPILEEFTDEQKKYYDFQFLIDNEKNQEQYPIIGYKHYTRDGIAWTKDRVGN